MKKLLLLLTLGLCAPMSFAQSLPSYVPADGLVGYWPFNGNANDVSGNGNNGTVNGATLTTDRFGNSNSAYYFNLFDFIQTDYLGISGNNERTISFWIKNQYSNRTINPLNYGGGNSTYGDSFFIRLNRNYQNDQCGCWPTTFEGAGIDGAHLHLIYSTVTGDNNWHNYVYVVGSSANNFRDIKIYRDGILISNTSQIIFDYDNASQSLSLNTYTNPSYPLTFGKSDAIISSAGSQLDAAPTENLDDIGMWNRALTQQEITTMYNSVEVPTYSDTCNNVSGSLTQGLVGYWPFCGNANDDSGNGNNGTVNGATLTTDRFGNTNSAYSFNGVNNYIKCLNAGPTGNPSITTSFWLKSSQSTYGHIIGYGNNGVSGNDFRVYINGHCNNGSISFDTYDNAKEPSTTFNNIWDFYVVIYDGLIGTNTTNAKIYKNGTLLTSDCFEQNISSTNISSLLPITFGRYHGTVQTGYFNGSLDDIGIWNRVLTQQEITQLFNQNQCVTNITVTDTLIINVGQLSYTNPVTYANNINIYPNPANTQVNISFTNITDLTGGTIKVVNSLGQQVATTPITLSGTNTTMPLTTWGGAGLYFVQIINPQGQIVDIKKIILQ